MFQLAFASGHIYSYDELIILETAANIVDRGEAAIDYAPDRKMYVRRGSDGKFYSVFGIGLSAFLMPFYFLGGDILASFANAVVIALIALVFYRFTSNAPATIILSCATILAPYGRGLFTDAFTGLAVLLAFVMVMRTRPAFAGAACAIAMATRFEYVLAAVALAPFVGRKNLIRFFTPVVSVGLLIATYNYARYGNPFDQGILKHNPGDTFSTPLWHGLAGLLISPGKGILWYSPPIILAIIGMRRMKRETIMILAVAIPIILLHAKWHSWIGGWSYGPRRFVALMPILMIPAVAVISRHPRLTMILAILGFGAQIAGLTTNFMTYHQWSLDHRVPIIWSIENSAMIGQLRECPPDLWYLNLFGPSGTAIGIALLAFAVLIGFRPPRSRAKF